MAALNGPPERHLLFDCWVHGNAAECDSPTPLYADPSEAEVAAARAHGHPEPIPPLLESANYQQGVLDGGVATVNRLLREGKITRSEAVSAGERLREVEREVIEAARDWGTTRILEAIRTPQERRLFAALDALSSTPEPPVNPEPKP